MQAGGISEEKRVLFTKQLLELRDSKLEQVAFSASLTSDERKFVHKISQEYGLKSKSQGSGDNRFITVLKKKGNVQKASGAAPALWVPHHTTLQALSDPTFMTAASRPAMKSGSFRGKPLCELTAPAAARDFSIPIDHYNAAQQARLHNKQYHSIQKKRAMLPAAHYRSAVCNLLKEHQMVLISGETGK
jgi:HrpA-like RNA helicase